MKNADMQWRKAGVFVRVSVSIEAIDESKELLLYDLLASSHVSRDPDVLSIGFSGFLCAINTQIHVLTSHWPFLLFQRTIDIKAMSISIKWQKTSTWIPCKLVYSSQLPCSCEKQIDKSSYPDKWGLGVLEIIDAKDHIKLKPQAFQLTEKTVCFEPQIASSLLVVANPFGLLNGTTLAGSILSGIVSQILPHEPACGREPNSPALILSDAVVFPGTQGGPVFDAVTKRFIGIVATCIQSLPPSMQRPVLTRILPVQSILQMTQRLPMKIPPKSLVSVDHQHHHDAPKALDTAIKSVVLLRTNKRTWATGVLLNGDGLLLTAGHVLLNETVQVEALVMCSSHTKSQWRPTSVVYVTSNARIDFALLQIEFSNPEDTLSPQYHIPCPWRRSGRPPTVGTRVFAIGFPTMDPFCSIGTTTTGTPLITSGIVSKLVTLPEDPSFVVMVRTSARIMNGHSGGMLVDADDGFFLGLIVSNLEWQVTNEQNRRMIIEQINASLPTWSILLGVLSSSRTSSRTSRIDIQEMIERPWKNQEKTIERLWGGSEESSSTCLPNTPNTPPTHTTCNAGVASIRTTISKL